MCVKIRLAASLLLAGILLCTTSVGYSAQPARVIRITMVSYKFDPSIVTFNAGDRVTLQLENTDPQGRGHSIASPYFSTVDYTVTGDAKQVVAPDGWKTIILDPGKKAEVTFLAQGKGQFTFVCEARGHAANGQTGQFIVWPAGYRP